jgi:AcrR family transcriptional regulator
MARWEPDARGRLESAALDLLTEKGFDGTTVADIAARAGVTERTFYRHFGDKRDMLFAGQAYLVDGFADAVAAAPPEASAIDAMGFALATVGTELEGRHDLARKRSVVIAANPGLQERELLKSTVVAAAISAALRARGVADLAAQLTAQTGMAVFSTAFQQWIAESNELSLAALMAESLATLKAVTAGA